jgi:MFS family permease
LSDPVEKQDDASRLRAARIAVAYMFFINGAVGGNWVTRIPALMDKLGLSVTMLAYAFFAAPLAAILAMPLVGPLVTKFGSRRTTRISFFLWCLSIAPIAFAPNLIVLGAVMFVIGAVSALMDVAMNAHGLVLERRYRRPILSSLHAWYSIGGLVGSGTGALAAWAGLDIRLHISLVVGIAVAGGLLISPFLLRGGDEVAQERQPFFIKPPRVLLALGAVAFISLLSEGAVGDWSAVYIHKPLHSSQAIAALGYFAFSFMMVAGRLSGDRLTIRSGPVALIRTGGLLAAVSLTAALLIGNPVVAIIGFAGMGAGLAAVVPTVFRAAGTRPDIPPGIGLASVSLIGYFGFLVGPPLIGSINHFIGLPKALGVVALFMAAIGFLAMSAAPSKARTQAPATTEE